MSARNERRIRDALTYIDNNSVKRLDLNRLANIAGMSKYHFSRKFRLTVGSSPYQYLLSVRLRRVALRLISTSDPVSFIAWEHGFRDLSTFNGHFRRAYGASPSIYRRRTSQ